jgi:hypothetical protein
VSPAKVTRDAAKSLIASRLIALATRPGCCSKTRRLKLAAIVTWGIPGGGTTYLMGDVAPWSSQSGPRACWAGEGQSARS